MKRAGKWIYNNQLNNSLTQKHSTGEQSDLENPFDGTVEIINGDLIIHPPHGFAKFPTIMPGENVEIFFNGNKVDHPILVQETDQIEINTLDTLPRVDMEIKLSEDKLTAYLTVTRIKGKKYALINSRPMNQQKIMARCVEEEEPESLHFDAIIKELHSSGIIYGIQNEAILSVIQSYESQITVEVAKGLYPSESDDATILYNFGNENDAELAKNPYSDGKIHSVSVGAIVAIKKPPLLGEPGVDVTGQQVLPRVPKDIPILIKDGVELIKEGTVAVATKSGRPVLEGNHKEYLSVRPLYIVQGDVDLRVGNIEFNGDILITGSVLDGFTVKAGGSISVYGDVMHASLYANGDIIIKKKAITANLRAGGSAVPYKRIYQLFNELSVRIESLWEAIKTIKNQPAFSTLDLMEKGDGQLIQLLLDYKFKDIPKLIHQLVEKILNERNEGFISEVIVTASLLSQKLRNLGPMNIRQDGEIEILLEEVRKTIEVVDRLLLNPANIIISYIQNSDIQASGDVIVTGQGIITSHVEAEGKISIAYGVVRGGELIARENIKALELGSPGDAEVNIKLLDNCSLEATIAHPVVVIRHGIEMKVIQENTRYLKAYTNNGRLTITENII